MGAYSRAKGVRFERAVATRLRKSGFIVHRILEYDGFAVGADLAAYDPKNRQLIRVAIQCKNTARERDLQVGLEEAKTGWPDALGWICVWNAGGSAGWRILIQAKTEAIATESTWEHVCKFLWWAQMDNTPDITCFSDGEVVEF